MFSEQFRKNLETGKYSKRAVDLTDEHLEALLWAVREYGCRSRHVLEPLWEHARTDDPAYVRAVLALEVIADFSHGRPINLDCLCNKVGEAIRAWRAQFPPIEPEET
jgi:hypothetical protein